jgi:hypothetical protein
MMNPFKKVKGKKKKKGKKRRWLITIY